jgi:EpsI family protein
MKLNLKNNLLLLLMVLSSAVATKFTPSSSLADELPKIYLKTMVPSEFGDWKEVLNTSTQIIDPQQKKTIEEIYSETFSKTYTNQVGYRIMLSIAYGKNQRDSLQLHKPEVCYPAQGFTLLSQSKDEISNLGESKKKIPITRLTTSLKCTTL